MSLKIVNKLLMHQALKKKNYFYFLRFYGLIGVLASIGELKIPIFVSHLFKKRKEILNIFLLLSNYYTACKFVSVTANNS